MTRKPAACWCPCWRAENRCGFQRPRSFLRALQAAKRRGLYCDRRRWCRPLSTPQKS
jgi:hypothetical protein